MLDIRSDYFIEREGQPFAGTHLLVEFWQAQNLTDPAFVETALKTAAEAAGATVLHVHVHHFGPSMGVTGVAILAESHISIHTWPERGYAALDIFMCGTCNPHDCVPVLERLFAPLRSEVGEHKRGLTPLSWFDETLIDGFHQRLEITRVLFQEKTGHQDLILFENPTLGRVLALDGIVQVTERDEFIYHEMLTHVPLLAYGSAKKVLIIGGGDGGSLREVLRHNVDTVTLVELDRTVIDLCLEFMPGLSNGAFDDPRTRLVIDDGVAFVAGTDDKFDVIIVDSTDPVGPGEVLFTEQFYRDCKRCLSSGGVLATQNGVPFFQAEEVQTTWQRLGPIFDDVSFYTTPVPTYVGGLMTLGWATDDMGLRQIPVDVLAERVSALNLGLRHYTPEVHKSAFALPGYISDLMS